MRRLLVIAILFLSACSGGRVAQPSPVETTAVNSSSATTPAAVSETTTPLPTIMIRLDDVEALAAGSDGVEVSWQGGKVRVTTEAVEAQIAIGAELEVSHRDGPVWYQTVAGPAVVLRQPWRTGLQEGRPAPVAMAWQAAGDGEAYAMQLEAAPGLNVISPKWWTLDPEGSLIGESDPGLVGRAAELGVAVWPYVTNGFDPARTALALASPANRKLLARQLSTAAREAGAAGVNVDFESFAVSERDSFSDLVGELAAELETWDGVLSVDITVLTSDFATVSESDGPIYDRRALASAADYLVLMAYDEYTTVRPFGPTASLEWTRAGIGALLQHADPHQVILGVPFYTRRWDELAPNAPGVVRLNEIEALTSSAVTREATTFGIERVVLPDGTFFWNEDVDLLQRRLQLVNELGLAGWAAWRLGFDSPALWESLGN